MGKIMITPDEYDDLVAAATVEGIDIKRIDSKFTVVHPALLEAHSRWQQEEAKKVKETIKTVGVNIQECLDREVKPIGEVYKQTAGKPKLSLIPMKHNYAIERVRRYGNSKYPDGGPDNWKKVPVEEYKEALYRHTFKMMQGEWLDPESGLPHLWHMMTNGAFIIEMREEI